MTNAVSDRRKPWPVPPAGLGDMLRLAGPVIMARLGIMVMGLVDAVVVGRYSAEQLGFHALGWAPTMALLVGAIGLMMGVQVMTARYIGEGRRRDTGAVYRRGMVFAFWIGAAAAALLIAGGPAFLHAIGLDPRLADGATAPLRVFALSMPVYLMGVAATFYLEAIGRPKIGMTVTWIGNLVNLGLNLLLVPGTLGLAALGAVGAAWATFGSRLFLTLVLIVIIARLKEARDLGVFDKPADGAAAAREQRRIGYAAGVSFFVEGGAFSLLNLIAGLLGAMQVAAWAVVLNVASLVFMVPLGLATATSVLVGRAYGAGDSREVRRVGVMSFAVSAAASAVIIAVVWPGATLIARSYTHEAAVIALIAPALVLSCLFYLADGLQAVAASALRARADVWMPSAIHVFNYAILMGPLCWVLAITLKGGVNGIVWGIIIASLSSALILVGRFLWLGRSSPYREAGEGDRA